MRPGKPDVAESLCPGDRAKLRAEGPECERTAMGMTEATVLGEGVRRGSQRSAGGAQPRAGPPLPAYGLQSAKALPEPVATSIQGRFRLPRRRVGQQHPGLLEHRRAAQSARRTGARRGRRARYPPADGPAPCSWRAPAHDGNGSHDVPRDWERALAIHHTDQQRHRFILLESRAYGERRLKAALQFR